MYRPVLLCLVSAVTLLCCVDGHSSHNVKRYEPTWESLDARPIPQWYDEAKIGIFLHWGVFSVPSYVGAWFWYWWQGPQPRFDIVEFMQLNYPPGFTYADFAPMFTAEFYNPDQWASIFQASGAQYVVLTTKHHEGFCLWPSKYSWNWNAMDVGPNRDLVGDLAVAVRKQGLKFGTYHSLFEFFHPLFLKDQENNFTTQEFVKSKTMPELYELVNAYKPDLVWSDGEWMAPDTYWNATNFLAWLYNDSPVKDRVVTNDRWGSNTMCHHGGYYTCSDSFNPKVKQAHKYEDATTMDKAAWTFRRNLKLSDVHTMEEVVTLIAEVVSTGGNLLINVGPTKEGTIPPIFEERLRQMGEWLKVNGEGIYATKPWSHQNDSLNGDVWYTSKETDEGTDVYAVVLKWPRTPVLLLADPVPTETTVVTLLGYSSSFQWSHSGAGLAIVIPPIPFNQMPCKWAWVFKLTNIWN
ncbi:alpha-L-fucosidase-like isoform X3 [Physella acuta]|uniref:alpha-L-fucosidase-like isoform X3 n=1 Tax=Physella acuta TaxID=109671 RepID=UPI0027DD80D3|nr:alpha-L-fucosidase-like isoform X3 [Physella acuta]